MPEQALGGVTVLDLSTGIAGPYCCKLLADYGADVMKVEQPGSGDPERRSGPFFRDRPDGEKSGVFYHLNTNKRSITLDIQSEAGRRILLELVRAADILVESYSPTTLPSLGLDYEKLKRIHPRVVMTSISNFGKDGPYRDYKISEIGIYAMGGPMHATGLPEREPVKLGGDILQYHAGAAAATATMVAFWEAEGGESGKHIDISLMRVQAANQDRRTTMLVGYQYTGEVNERRAGGATVAAGVRPCADGYINFAGVGPRFSAVCQMIGRPELLQDDRFKDDVSRAQPARAEEFDQYLLPWLLQFPKREVFQRIQSYHVPSGPLNTSADLVADAHLKGRRYWTSVRHPVTGDVLYPSRPFIMDKTPWQIHRAAPMLGQHNVEVFGGLLGYSHQEIGRLHQMGIV